LQGVPSGFVALKEGYWPIQRITMGILCFFSSNSAWLCGAALRLAAAVVRIRDGFHCGTSETIRLVGVRLSAPSALFDKVSQFVQTMFRSVAEVIALMWFKPWPKNCRAVPVARPIYKTRSLRARAKTGV
jgi:hypothetical protein